MRYADFNQMDFVDAAGAIGRGVHANGDFGNYIGSYELDYLKNINDQATKNIVNTVLNDSGNQYRIAQNALNESNTIDSQKIIKYAITGIALVGVYLLVKRFAK